MGVDRLVRAHGGSVEARSQGRGSGSEFIVRLRAYRLPEVPHLPSHSDVTAQATTAKDGQEWIAAASQFRPRSDSGTLNFPGSADTTSRATCADRRQPPVHC